MTVVDASLLFDYLSRGRESAIDSPDRIAAILAAIQLFPVTIHPHLPLLTVTANSPVPPATAPASKSSNSLSWKFPHPPPANAQN